MNKLKLMATFKHEIISKLQSNTKAIYRLSYEFNVHSSTVNRWLALELQAEDPTQLQTTAGIRAIEEELEIKRDNFFIE